jgi:hypothetical protein
MILLSDILRKVTEKDIMEHYYNCSIKDRKAIYKNLLRNDDKPTCYFNWYRGHYYLVDRGRGRDSNFDCFTLVKSIYNCNFSEALCFINRDMNLNLSSDVNIILNKKTTIVKNKQQTVPDMFWLNVILAFCSFDLPNPKYIFHLFFIAGVTFGVSALLRLVTWKQCGKIVGMFFISLINLR